MLDRDSGRRIGRRLPSSKRLVWASAGGALAVSLVGLLGWLAWENSGPQQVEAIAMATPVDANAARSGGQAAGARMGVIVDEAPSGGQEREAAQLPPPAVDDRAGEAGATEGAAIIQDEVASPRVAAAVQDDARPDSHMATAHDLGDAAPAPASEQDEAPITAAPAAPAPKVAAAPVAAPVAVTPAAAPKKNASKKVAHGVAEPRARHVSKLAHAEKAHGHTAAKASSAAHASQHHAHQVAAKSHKTQPSPQPAQVDSDVALISAVIQHANRHGADQAGCDGANCAAKTTSQP